MTAPIVVPCLSITAAWAFFVCAGKAPKDVENRTWNTKFRGTFLVHVGKKLTRSDWEDACDYALAAGVKRNALPHFDTVDLPLGGIVGATELLDVLPPGSSSESPWYQDDFGFLLGRRMALPFRALKGARQFFPVEISDAEAVALRKAGLLPE